MGTLYITDPNKPIYSPNKLANVLRTDILPSSSNTGYSNKFITTKSSPQSLNVYGYFYYFGIN